jgi:hypothetical protein
VSALQSFLIGRPPAPNRAANVDWLGFPPTRRGRWLIKINPCGGGEFAPSAPHFRVPHLSVGAERWQMGLLPVHA